MTYVDELSQPQQIALWERRAAMPDMRSPRPDPQLAARLSTMEPKLRQALDLGCGCGRHLLLLAQNGWRPTGLDWSGEALTHARQLLEQHEQVATLAKGDLRRTPFDSGAFALVISVGVLQHGHLADFKRGLIEIKRVLRVGGTALISVPGRANMPPAHWGTWPEDGTLILDRTEEAGLPHHFFSERELESAVRLFPRGSRIEKLQLPFPRDFVPYSSEQRNEWFWLTLTG